MTASRRCENAVNSWTKVVPATRKRPGTVATAWMRGSSVSSVSHVFPRYRVTALYRMYAADGELLYVGISYNPERRAGEHAEDKPWFGEVDHIDTEWYQFRTLAEDAENVAIWEEHPRYNIARILPRTPLAGRRLLETSDLWPGIDAWMTEVEEAWAMG